MEGTGLTRSRNSRGCGRQNSSQGFQEFEIDDCGAKAASCPAGPSPRVLCRPQLAGCLYCVSILAASPLSVGKGVDLGRVFCQTDWKGVIFLASPKELPCRARLPAAQ